MIPRTSSETHLKWNWMELI